MQSFLLTDYDVIVSNPPYSKRTAVYTRLFESGVPFAVVGSYNGLFDSKERYDIFSKNDFELLIPKGRVKFISPYGEKRAPITQSIYICSHILDEQITFCDIKASEREQK